MSNMILMPCMHFVVCDKCGNFNKICPVCKGKIDKSVVVYR